MAANFGNLASTNPLASALNSKLTQTITPAYVNVNSTGRFNTPLTVNPNTGAFGNSKSQDNSGPANNTPTQADIHASNYNPGQTAPSYSTGTPATSTNQGNATGGYATPTVQQNTNPYSLGTNSSGAQGLNVNPTPSQTNPTGYNPNNPTNPSGGLYGQYTNSSQSSNTTAPIDSSQPGAYAAYVSSLGNTQNSPYNQSVGNSINALNNTGAGNFALGQNAQNIGNSYQSQEQALLPFIGQAGGAASTGIGPVSTGLAGLAYNNLSNRQGVLNSAENAALSGNAQALTAQGQAANAFGAAAGAANTAQGNVQGATSSAAGYSAPSSNFPFVFNPTTGQFSAPGVSGGNSSTTAGAPTLTYNPNTDATNLAQQVIAGKIPYSDAVSAMGYAATGGGLLSTAITNQGGNIAQLEGQASGTQSASAATGGVQAALTGKYQAGLAALRSADNIQKNIVSTLAQNPTLNSTPVSAITNLNQLLSGQISSGPQQQLSQEVSSYLSALGVDPTTAVQLASQSKGTLADLLDTIRSNYQATNEGNNPANVTSPTAPSNTNAGGYNGTPAFGSFN